MRATTLSLVLAGTISQSLALPELHARALLSPRQSASNATTPTTPTTTASSLPSVNLGYEVHTGTENVTGQYYIFSNIPYAEQPTGTLRFHTVSLPTGTSSAVNNGSTNVICHQALPLWEVEAEATSLGYSVELVEEAVYVEAGQTEACLMLDLFVPTAIFDKASSSTTAHKRKRSCGGQNSGSGSSPTTTATTATAGANATSSTPLSPSSTLAPVLLWIHGGGFTFGSKTSSVDPAGLIARSTLKDSDEGIIVIAINYRLGLFGWLGGGGITPNLGLYDQRVAFDWAAKYVSLFGGDPDRITVAGESAGAASILHHVTAYGGAAAHPFAQALIQSPAFQTDVNLTQGYERTLAEAVSLTNQSITTADQLAALSEAELHAVNFYTVLAAEQGFFNFGPAPDGTYVPALPQVLLYEGRFRDDIKVMPAHNSLEAASFVSTSITTEADVVAEVTSAFPKASNETVTYLLDVLYPAAAYASEYLRTVQIASDAQFSCSTRFLAQAFGNETYNYLFAYPPGYHGEDLDYTFFNGDTTTLDDGVAVNAALAYDLQDYIVGFVQTGDPNKSPAGPALQFPTYGSNSTVVKFSSSGLQLAQDDMDNARCPWWQQAFVTGLV